MLLSNIHEPIGGGKPFAEREGHRVHRRLPASAERRCRALVRAARCCRRCARGCPASSSTSSAARCRRRFARWRRRDFVVTGHVADIEPFFDRLPAVDRAAALRRGRQGQGQPGDELRPAGGRDVDGGRGHAPRAGDDVLVADDPRALRGRDRPRLPRRVAVAALSRPAASRTSVATSRVRWRGRRSTSSSRSPTPASPESRVRLDFPPKVGSDSTFRRVRRCRRAPMESRV